MMQYYYLLCIPDLLVGSGFSVIACNVAFLNIRIIFLSETIGADQDYFLGHSCSYLHDTSRKIKLLQRRIQAEKSIPVRVQQHTTRKIVSTMFSVIFFPVSYKLTFWKQNLLPTKCILFSGNTNRMQPKPKKPCVSPSNAISIRPPT